MTYEMVDSDDEMSLLSGRTPDLLSTLSTRHRHTSRHSLLDEIIKQVGPYSDPYPDSVVTLCMLYCV